MTQADVWMNMPNHILTNALNVYTNILTSQNTICINISQRKISGI